MEKTISLLLAVCLVLGLTAGTASASTSATSAQQIVQALGIINGDENGNLNLSSNVSRAEFAKMMVAASSYKDTISSTAKSSPFKDVKYTHWAASYVQTAVTSGWLSGYTDGTYRPDNSVKLEEAVSAVLKMLGYSSSDFTGSFPEAQLAKYSALGLNTSISAAQGQTLTRQDCMYLFYNLMSTKNKSGSYYATTLGYTVNSSGEIAYSSLVLANMKGPFIVEDSSWSSDLPFTASAATVYRNGSVSSISSVSTYDVYYYNTGMSTVWVYSNNVTGVYTAASPSSSAPTSVTVAGQSYTISAATAAYALSDLGSYHIGDTVTLLIGMDGDVVGVADSSTLSGTKYGIVSSTGSTTYTDSSGNIYYSDTISVFCSDGSTYTYEYSNSSFSKGNLVQITFTSGDASISLLSDKTLAGTINDSGTTFAGYTFADSVRILDTTSNGSCLKIYPARLAGLTLSSSDVRYYILDTNGEISDLILNDVTGDMYEYGVVTSSSGSYSSGTSSYKYYIGATTGTYSSSSTYFSATTGPVLIEFSGSSIVKIQNLNEMTLSSVNSYYATASGTQYALADSVYVYTCTSGSYYPSSISAISGSGYTLRGYYDMLPSSGGRIRVIIAYAN